MTASEKDVRPGDVWEEIDGDFCFIIDRDPDEDRVGNRTWNAVAYYNATMPRQGFRFEANGVTREDRQLKTLVHRQTREDSINRNADTVLRFFDQVASAFNPVPVAPLPEPRDDLRWLAVDLDGTIAESVWTPGNPTRAIGEPIWKNVHKVWRIKEEGYKVVIHTARGWEHYEAIESWLGYHGLPFDKIVCGKLLALRYIDDRAIHSEEDSWLPS